MARSKKNVKKTKKPLKELAEQKALLDTSARSADSRRRNLLSNMANARIRGHAGGAQRRAQARRDSKNRRA